MDDIIINFEIKTNDEINELISKEKDKLKDLELKREIEEEFPNYIKGYNSLEYDITRDHIKFLENLLIKNKI